MKARWDKRKVLQVCRIDITLSSRSIDTSINDLVFGCDGSTARLIFKNSSLYCSLSPITWARAILEHQDATMSLLR